MKEPIRHPTTGRYSTHDQILRDAVNAKQIETLRRVMGDDYAERLYREQQENTVMPEATDPHTPTPGV
jgi:hypothetical protein